MITTSDIAEQLYDRCKVFGVEVRIAGVMPIGKPDGERIVIIPKTIEDGTRWYRLFSEVNWIVPDIRGEMDALRVKEVERAIAELFYGQGEIDGTLYRFRKYSIGREREKDFNCHYVNLRLLVEIQKVI